MWFILNVRFTNQQKGGTNHFTKVYAIHHALKCMNILHNQMPKPMMVKLKYIIWFDDCITLHVFAPCTLIKFILYRFHAITSPSGHLIRLHSTSTHVIITCSPRAIFLCSLDIWRFYADNFGYVNIYQHLNMNDPIPIALIMWSSPKCVFYGVITPCGSNIILWKVIYSVAPACIKYF